MARCIEPLLASGAPLGSGIFGLRSCAGRISKQLERVFVLRDAQIVDLAARPVAIASRSSSLARVGHSSRSIALRARNAPSRELLLPEYELLVAIDHCE